jgi:hypothetical protein
MSNNKNWTINHQNKYSSLYRYLEEDLNMDVRYDDYIETYKRQLMSIIEKSKKKDNSNYSDGYKENWLFMVARYLHLYGDNRYSKLYSEAGYKYMIKNKNIEKSNVLDEKEKINYRSRDFFINILNSIDYNNIKTIERHYQYLLLNMLVYQPPLRTSFYTGCTFIQKESDNDKKHNFIKFDRRGKIKVYYIINKDKASNYKVYNMNKSLNKIKIEDNNLAKLIYDSYIKYPRKYLFEIKNKGITPVTLLAWLRKITNIDGINIDMMRSSYVNYFYADNNKNMKEKEDLAHSMRHSVLTAQTNYLKISNDTKEDKEDIINNLQTEIYNLKNNNNTQVDIKDKKYKKQRYDIIYKLNTIKGSKPRENTLIKYNITYDNIKNIYI